MRLSDYLQAEGGHCREAGDVFGEIFTILDDISQFYTTVLSGFRNTEESSVDDRIVEILLFYDSQRFWLSGCSIWARGHLTECLPLFRGAIEATAYARKISRSPGLGSVWLSRRERAKEFNAAFRDGGIEKQLFPPDDAVIGKLLNLFQATSLFGVHANSERLAFGIQFDESKSTGGAGIRLLYGSNDAALLRQAGIFCATIGIRILEVYEVILASIDGTASWEREWPGLGNRVLGFLERER